MKKVLLFIFGFLVSTTSFSIGVIVLEGTYQGKNVNIQNSFDSSGVGFCVQEIRVNGNVTSDEIASSTFDIDLRNFQFKLGDKVEIRIIHKDNCKPKVLNTEALNPKSTFEIVSMTLESDLIFKWTTKRETGKLPYFIEQFRWNKWVKVGEVEGNGTAELNNYSFKVVPYSGKNQYRVKQVDYTGQPKFSKTLYYTSSSSAVTYSPAEVSKEIKFLNGKAPTETMFEIYDQFGNIVKRGFASRIDASSLTKGVYNLNYDNETGIFIKN